MGIRFLNKYLRKKCINAIQCVSFKELENKKIAVDISIYIYKYLADNTLIESFYMMMGFFRKYNITPVFIFDGKPPAQKKELLKARRNTRMESEREYAVLKDKIDELSDDEDKKELLGELEVLKRKIIYITKKQIADVKELISAFGYSYYEALGEADELCANLVLTNQVWGCMSEDMDMFVYGCHRVIRYFSLLKGTFVVYNMKEILEILKMNQDEFRRVCILSGTDYHIPYHTNKLCEQSIDNVIQERTKSPDINIFTMMELFDKYKISIDNNHNVTTFYQWLKCSENNNDINIDINELIAIEDMFILLGNDITNINNTGTNTNKYQYLLDINEVCYDRHKVRTILENNGFIFGI